MGGLNKGLFLIVILSVVTVQAATSYQYRYDSAGNIVEVLSRQITAVPVIEQIFPANILRETPTPIQISGQHLFGAELIFDEPSVLVSEQQSDQELLRFVLTIPATTSLGDLTFILRNALGETSGQLNVVRQIDFSMSPSLLVIPQNDVYQSLVIGIGEVLDQSYQLNITVDDTALLELPPMPVEFPAGESSITLLVKGLKLGDSTVKLTYLEDLLATPLGTIRVSDETFVGDMSATSATLGVRLLGAEQHQTLSISKPVGVKVRNYPLRLTSSVGVRVESTALQLTPSTGVRVETTAPQLSPSMGVKVSDE